MLLLKSKDPLLVPEFPRANANRTATILQNLSHNGDRIESLQSFETESQSSDSSLNSDDTIVQDC